MSFLTKRLISTVTTFVHTNEYKFYIDFKGLLYFEDTRNYIYPNAIKDKKFITYLYNNLITTQSYYQNKINKITKDNNPQNSKAQHNPSKQNLENDKQKYKQYPYVAQFWGQINYVKTAVAPIVFNRILEVDKIQQFQSLQIPNSTQKVVQFSMGQYSLFNLQKIKIDSDGRLWHPFIKPKPSKQKNENIDSLWGVFSNELVSDILENVSHQNQETFLNYEGKRVKLNAKEASRPTNS